MQKSVFLHEFRQSFGLRLTDDYILFRKPLELYNLKTGDSKLFKSMEEVYSQSINEITVGDMISKMTLETFYMRLDGGRGASSGLGQDKSFKFSHADDKGARTDTYDFPSRVNINIRNPDKTLEVFRNLHVNDKKEHAFTVDEQRFVTSYVHGMAHSVMVAGRRGEMVYHNHPSGGAFSDADLISTALTAAKGIVASGKSGDYILQKGNHFKANAFVKAVNNAHLKGKDYDDAVDRWLKANAKKYDYKYEFRKCQDELKTL